MNKLITILIALSLLVSISNLSFADQDIRRPVTIPAEMYKIKSPFGFEDYLGNPDKRI